MASAVSLCPRCGRPGRWGFDDDWCHELFEDAARCDREGYVPTSPAPGPVPSE